MVVCSWPFLGFDFGGGIGRRGLGDAAEVRGDGLAASVARGGGPVAMVWRIALRGAEV